MTSPKEEEFIFNRHLETLESQHIQLKEWGEEQQHTLTAISRQLDVVMVLLSLILLNLCFMHRRKK
jgi:ABC-type lipoprotein release transport system permease subunit